MTPTPVYATLALALSCLICVTAQSGSCNATNPCSKPYVGCCSQFGFCGGDPAHCGSNCVPGNSYNKNCTTPAPVCGAASSTKASCPLATAPCCSKAGYCGGSAAECTPDCQSAYSYNQTCSLPATCGPTEGSCPEAFYCCSAAGECGVTPSMCGIGCQPKYSFEGSCGVPVPDCGMGVGVCKKSKPCCDASGICGTSDTNSCGVPGCQATYSLDYTCDWELPRLSY